MEPVTTPTFGSVGYFANMIRRYARVDIDIQPNLVGILGAIVGDAVKTDAEKVEHVRNALAAAELVYAEMRQRARFGQLL